MEPVVRRKGPEGGPEGNASMAARKRFGRYTEEANKRCSGPAVKEDKAIIELVKAWEACDIQNDTDYDIAYDLLEGFDCSPEDVQRFCIAAKQFEDESMFEYKLGFVLSALINASSYDRFELSLGHLDIPPASLCGFNFKKVDVTGDVGDHFGEEMESGEILLIGNAGWDLGKSMEGGKISAFGSAISVGEFMLGGEIEVRGNVTMNIGMDMEGGAIRVQGNCDGSIGAGMKGGEIHLEGDGGVISPQFEAGRIYRKGKLIFQK
jgi:hypothetical protein